MVLTIYNTLTRHKEPFEPIEPGKVRMYCCGITAYDYCHLGHGRTCLIWDVVRRYLEWCGYQVQYVQNFTDIDDKILKRAREEGSSMEEVSERFIAAYFEDMERLHVGKANAYPRATHALDGIKRLVHELEEGGYAYPAGGDVYYAVRRFPEYGKLSGRKLEDLQAGASGRVDLEDPEAARKKDPFDFALWKAAKAGEPAWDSPWGQGRPGWHIECSAMVRERLGETIDLHVGGSDLIFPHHENEIAQSEAATGKPLARYWLHNGMVKVEGEKMSKSLGNFITIRELLDQVEPMAVRLFILQAHYRKPLDFTEEALAAATNGWHTLKEGLLFGYHYAEQLGWDDLTPQPPSLRGKGEFESLSPRKGEFKSLSPRKGEFESLSPRKGEFESLSPRKGEFESLSPRKGESEGLFANSLAQRFREAVDDDFNFAEGLAVLFEIAKELRREGNLLVHQGQTETPAPVLRQQWRTLVELATVLGFAASPAEVAPEASVGLSDGEVEALIEQRAQARKAKNYALGDRLRDELKAKGIILIDQPGGVTKWHRQ